MMEIKNCPVCNNDNFSNHIKSKGFKVSTSKTQNFEALANQISNNYII